MKALALIAAALLLPQEKNEAEELFKKMEERLSRAETLHVDFKSTFEQERKNKEKVSGLLSGSIMIDRGGKARLEVDGKIGGPIAACIVSDGKSTVLVEKEPSPIQPSPTSPELRRNAILHLARLGGVTAVMEARRELSLAEMDRKEKPEPRETDAAKTMRLRDFKKGPAEKIDGRDVTAIQYVAEDLVRNDKALVSLWIDSVTFLPIRRRVVVEDKGILIEETFTLFKIDEKVDPMKFELPKAR
jgi:outer membrane lipoprotein-sorting protein